MQQKPNPEKDFHTTADDRNLQIKYRNESVSPVDVCIFSSYSFTGIVEEYVYFYLNELQKTGFSIVFVSTSPLQTACVSRLSAYTFLILERENRCPDFGSWKLGLSFLNWGKGLHSVLLVNDSVFGPFYNLGNIISSMKKKYDVWGMTDNYEINYHLQSYFLFFNPVVLESDTWLLFWKNVDISLPKKEVIVRYEAGLTTLLSKAGFSVGAYGSADTLNKNLPQASKLINATLGLWKVLIENNEFPFLKRENLIKPDINKLYWDRGYYLNVGKWKRIVENTGYPVQYITEFLKNYFEVARLKNESLVLRTRKILFLSHNAETGGAQRVLLNLLQWLTKETYIELEIIICRPGKSTELAAEFSAYGPVTYFYNLTDEDKLKFKERLIAEQVAMIFSNTIANVGVQRFLSFLDVPQVIFVHELSHVLKVNLSAAENIGWVRTHVNHFIACATAVKTNLAGYLGVNEDIIDVVHEFVNPPETPLPDNAQQKIRVQLGIPPDAFVAGMCGTFEWRKSADMLPSIAFNLCRKENNIHLIWLGADTGSQLYQSVLFDLEKAGLKDRVHLVESTNDSQPFFSLFDVFLMVSREDPFPLVNLESGLAGKPVICFDGAGGSGEYVELGTGLTVPYMDFTALTDAVLSYYNNPGTLEIEKTRIPQIVKNNFTTAVQAPKILNIIRKYYDQDELTLIEDPVVAFMTHIYYENSWSEIKSKLKNFENGRNYFLFSISEACMTREHIIEDIKRSFKNTFVLITSNIGKDIGGKLMLIDIYLLLNIRATYIVFLHDKQSPQTLVGESWKNNLFKIVNITNHRMILDLFKDPAIGMIGAKEHIINEYDSNTDTFRHNNLMAKRMLKQYSISIKNYEYLSGTMYWMRASLIENFFSKNNPVLLRQGLEEGNIMDIQNEEGTLAHTWERMFCWIAANEGYTLRGI